MFHAPTRQLFDTAKKNKMPLVEVVRNSQEGVDFSEVSHVLYDFLKPLWRGNYPCQLTGVLLCWGRKIDPYVGFIFLNVLQYQNLQKKWSRMGLKFQNFSKIFYFPLNFFQKASYERLFRIGQFQKKTITPLCERQGFLEFFVTW